MLHKCLCVLFILDLSGATEGHWKPFDSTIFLWNGGALQEKN